MSVGDRIGRTRFHAITAKNATRIVDVVDARVALSRGDALDVGILRSLDVNTARRARGGAQKAAHAFFQSVFVAVENMNAAVPRLEMNGFFGIVFCDGLAQHVAKRDAKALYERDERFTNFFDDRCHRVSV